MISTYELFQLEIALNKVFRRMIAIRRANDGYRILIGGFWIVDLDEEETQHLVDNCDHHSALNEAFEKVARNNMRMK